MSKPETNGNNQGNTNMFEVKCQMTGEVIQITETRRKARQIVKDMNEIAGYDQFIDHRVTPEWVPVFQANWAAQAK
jgi:hypothetical protein